MRTDTPAARVRHLIHRRLRRPRVYAVAAVSLAAVTGGVAYRFLDAAAEGAERYGDPVTVAVVVHELSAGDRLSERAVEMRELPRAAVPPSAVTSASIGRVLRRDISPGEVLVRGDLSRPGTSEIAAALPVGTVALAVPTGDARLELHRGDRVDLLVPPSDDPAASEVAPFDTGGGAITRGAVVVAVDETQVTVAVPEDDAAEVAAAVSVGGVVPALKAS